MNKNYKDVVIIDRKTTYIADDAIIEKNVIIYPNNYVDSGSVIKENSTLLPGNYIIGSTIGKGSKLHNSVVENAFIGECSIVGPFSHIRPNSKLGQNVKVGNFCEIKNSIVGDNTKISHHAYVGDAEIGQNCNISCGVIFANYDGAKKHKSYVGNNCFIGCNCNIISPIVLADNSYICAGATIRQSTKENDFVIQKNDYVIKENYKTKYIRKKQDA